ncbi:hypothetical protein AMAG_10554 [Allomyces macrogynus ATCC 38327]|uniref:Rrp15p-domain-containing protein n=1 Tax=Allomyces macrogynus (strain ATCC 38327) TaxID=578462 RepID=A0A0L0SUY8_ALLM3|nr:hypothetical protein AMAG_10554 [Allomyces macrogynus ATCC 38327]|eukprot:KNE66332.1 hypothetical protein AMAG_10554 [Allomyces macrogynus ATCC 38327]
MSALDAAMDIELPESLDDIQISDNDDEVMDDSFDEAPGSDDDDRPAARDSDADDEGDADDEDDDDHVPRKTKQSKRPKKPLNEAIAAILGTKAPASTASAPILSRSGVERRLDEEKIEEKARKILASETKIDYARERVKPKITDLEYEKKLRKVATRGVVKLFNAVRQAQQRVKEVKEHSGVIVERREEKAKVASTAKSTFMDIMRRGTHRPATTSVLFGNTAMANDDDADEAAPPKAAVREESEAMKAKGTWSVLNDDFMLDAKLKDWGEAENEEDEMEFE